MRCSGPDAKAKAAALKPRRNYAAGRTPALKGRDKKPALAKAMASMAKTSMCPTFWRRSSMRTPPPGNGRLLPPYPVSYPEELEIIGGALANPKRPLVAVLGGSKVSSKIGVINNLLEIADFTIIIGGGMALHLLQPPRAARWGTVCWRPIGRRLRPPRDS